MSYTLHVLKTIFAPGETMCGFIAAKPIKPGDVRWLTVQIVETRCLKVENKDQTIKRDVTHVISEWSGGGRIKEGVWFQLNLPENKINPDVTLATGLLKVS